MSRSRRCCCNTTGLTRGFGDALVFNYIEGLAAYPCFCDITDGKWMLANLGVAQLIGYDPARKWYFYTGTGSGMSALQLDKCTLGISPPTPMFDATTADDIITGTYPGDVGSASGLQAGFSGWTAGRFYGYTAYFYFSDHLFHQLIWSVDETGGDYTEVASNTYTGDGTFDTVNSRWFLPSFGGGSSCWVQRSIDDATNIWIDGGVGLAVGEVYKNNNSFNSWIDPVVLSIEGQFLFAGTDQTLPYISGTGLYALSDPGDLFSASQVDFAPIEYDDDDAPHTVFYKPASMGWDVAHNAVVVWWVPYYGWGGFGDPAAGSVNFRPKYRPGYVTYINKAITPGNIIGQSGVDIYAYLPAYGADDFGSQAAPMFGHVISGKLPTPLTIDAGVLPDPVGPPPDCDTFLDCVSEMQLFFKQWGDDLAAHDVAGGDIPFGGVINIDGLPQDPVTRHWHELSLNSVLLDVTFLAGGVIPDDGGRPASGLGAVSANQRMFWAPFGTFGDHSDPGIAAWTDHFSDTAYHHEKYICGIFVVVECSDGLGRIAQVAYEWQAFKGKVGATDPDSEWPQSDSGNTYLGNPFAHSSDDETILIGVPSDCVMSGMRSIWEFFFIEDTGPSTSGGSINFFGVASPLT